MSTLGSTHNNTRLAFLACCSKTSIATPLPWLRLSGGAAFGSRAHHAYSVDWDELPWGPDNARVLVTVPAFLLARALLKRIVDMIFRQHAAPSIPQEVLSRMRRTLESVHASWGGAQGISSSRYCR